MNKLLFGLLSLVLFSNAALAEDPVLALQLEIEEQIEKIVHSYDDYAQVIVKIDVKKIEQKLPGTPLTLSKMIIRSKQDRMIIDSAKVDIYSHSAEIPEKTRGLINDVFATYNIEPEIAIGKPANKYRFSVVQVWEELTRPNMVFVYLSYLFLAFLTVLFFMQKKKQDKSFFEMVQSNINQVKSVFEDSAPKSQIDFVEDENDSSSLDESDKNLIAELPKESVEALLYDCYWSEKDNYAAFVWSKVNVDMRKNIIDNDKRLKQYVQYISSFSHDMASYHQDPYYLNPLPVNHISNNDMVATLSKHSHLYKHLSSIRMNHIEITVQDRLDYITSDLKELDLKVLRDLKAITESEARHLRRRMKIHVQNLEEEQQALALDNPSIETMEDVVMLSWADKLSEESLKDVMKSFAAADLASAWIAPVDILEKFKASLPEKKLNLVESYIQKQAASRKSQVYSALHRAIVSKIKENASSSDKDVENVA